MKVSRRVTDPRAGDRATLNRRNRYEAFARRINKAADTHPRIPALGRGRLTFVRGELEKVRAAVSLEAVRRWFSGEAIPRRQYASALAEVLKVDELWLLEGEQTDRSGTILKSQDALARGAVNLLAGFIQMDGGAIAFPDEQMKGLAPHVDLHAIVGGVSYAIHVAEGKTSAAGQVTFSVPTNLGHAVCLGIHRESGYTWRIHTVGALAVQKRRRGAAYAEVALGDKAVREIRSFNEPLRTSEI